MQSSSNRRSNINSEWVEQSCRKDRRNITHINNKEINKHTEVPNNNTRFHNRNRYENVARQPGQESVSKHEVAPYQPKPVTRNYAGVIKPDSKGDDTPTYNVTYDGTISTYKFFNIYPKRKVRNQLPKDRNSSIGSWEYAYFKHILELKRIFEEGIKNLKTIRIDTKSVEFIDNFSRFIKEYSSGEISKFLEELNEYEEDIFFKYITAKAG